MLSHKKLLYTDVTWQGSRRKVAVLFEDEPVNEPKKPIRFSSHPDFLEFEFPESAPTYSVGNIYVGRIEKVAPSVGACFVTLKDHVNGFLPECERSSTWLTRQTRSGAPVAGEEILVQISREAHGGKLCSLTTELSISGTGLVVLWGQRMVRTSGKLSAEQKKQFQKLGNAFLDACQDLYPVGILFRTNAAKLSEEALFAEFQTLRTKLLALIQKGRSRMAGTCLFQTGDGMFELLKRNLPLLEEIITDDPVFYEKCKMLDLPSACKLLFWQDPMQFLAKACSLSQILDRGLSPRVELPGGGWILIEPTEAFVAIDVNSGPVSGRDAESYYRKVNYEAARAVAREIRLRNLSGLILVDFITMKEQAEEEKLLGILNSYLREDSVPCRAVDFTAMHICEISRKKVKKTLFEQ